MLRNGFISDCSLRAKLVGRVGMEGCLVEGVRAPAMAAMITPSNLTVISFSCPGKKNCGNFLVAMLEIKSLCVDSTGKFEGYLNPSCSAVL